MEEKTAFNIALFPQDKQFIADCIKLAQDNFDSQAEEYLLGENALPHITLCQFSAAPSHLAEIWSIISPLVSKSLSIRLTQIYILPYEGAYWLGLATAREPELISLQLSVYESLANLGIKSNQSHSSYFPHITWARCSGNKPPELTVMPAEKFWSTPQLFNLSIGESSPYGVYRKRLFPKPRASTSFAVRIFRSICRY